MEEAFNPTVVRLGRWWAEVTPTIVGDFQSHCGAIGTTRATRPTSPSPRSFNPTVVRLGRVPRRLRLGDGHPFNPTVVRLGRADGIGIALVEGAVFQSHCGAIGTPLMSRRHTATARRLSIPLWCDWDMAELSSMRAILPTFNPTVVRLGRGLYSGPPAPAAPFQSHCGAIGTRPTSRATPSCTHLSIPLWCDWDLVIYLAHHHKLATFNPTVVRLGQGIVLRLGRSQAAFNPTVVRLGRIAPSRVMDKTNAFNPTVVRLGPERIYRQGKLASVLSIPLWCDWDGAVEISSRNRMPLSIPLWCDWDRGDAAPPVWLAWLSIPLWCDWDIRQLPPSPSHAWLSIPLWCDWDPYGPYM